MEGGDMQPEPVEDSNIIYKKQSFQVAHPESQSGLDPKIDVLDGKLVEKVEPHPIHGVLHIHKDDEEPHHNQHHVHIEKEVLMVEIPAASNTPPSPTEDQKPSVALAQASHHEKSHTHPHSHHSAEVVHTLVSLKKKSSYLHPISEALKGEGIEVNDDADMLDSTQVFDEEFERKREKQQRKVQINKGTLKTLQQVFSVDTNRQDLFLESVLASHHMKELTSRYGSKQKNPKQFFLEAVDTDTRLAVFGASQISDAKAGLQRLDKKRNFPSDVASRAALEEESNTSFPSIKSASIDGEETGPVKEAWSKKNFWASLERIEREQDPNAAEHYCGADQGNHLFEIYADAWKNKQIQATPQIEIKKPSFHQQRFESFPDKYLELGAQEVMQSEAVRRLWDIVNTQLDLFDANDPLAQQMFGSLYDEVRAFIRLPEEEIDDFNNGGWSPETLDEKKILQMEPCEKLKTRFAVHQKAFSFMAQHFETMTPIFAEIKQAYEDVFEKAEKETLEVEKEQMEELELRNMLGKYIRQTDKAGHRLLMEVKAEAHALQEHIQWQHHTFHTILGMLWKMRSSLKLTNWAVTQLKNLHKTKIEALAKEIVSTQGQMLFDMALPGKYTEIMQRIRNSSDPIEIRRMLLAVRRQLRVAHRKIVVYEADYADTVPKAEFEVPQKKFSIISKKNEALSEACNMLKTERTLRKQAIAALKSEIYETSGLVKDLKRKPTPRPSWTKISNDWPGGQSKFSEMKEGQSTRWVINKVVEELSGKKVGELTTYIKPKGMSESVPIFLRYDKPLLDRNFSAAEAMVFIKDVWKRRVDIVRLYRKIKQARKDEEEGIASYPDDLQYDLPIIGTFPEYIAEYFEKRCHLKQIRMEWIYNLVEACKRHSSDQKLALFKGILDGTIDESMYHLFQMDLDKLRDVMYAKANASHDYKGYLQWPDVMKFVMDLCPNKTEEQINAIDRLGGVSFGVRGSWAVVRATSLFEADDDGKESDFIELLYQQFEDERKEYIRDIYMDLLTELGISEKLLEHEDDPVWQTDVSMHMFYAGLLSIDPTLPDHKLIAYIAWVYLGVTALPGVATLGTRLIDFLRDRSHLTESDLEKYNEDEDIEFEDCIREIRDYEDDDAVLDKLDQKKRRLATKKLKFASLRQVMDRLYSGPFTRHGIRLVKSKAVEPEPEVAAVDAEKEDRKHRHRHHRHHRHRHEKRNKKDQFSEEEEGDDGFYMDF